MKALGPSTNLSPSPIRRNCCRFLALRDKDFLVSSLLDNGILFCEEVHGDGN